MESASRSRRPRDRVVAPSGLGPFGLLLTSYNTRISQFYHKSKAWLSRPCDERLLCRSRRSPFDLWMNPHQSRGDIHMPDTVQKITPFLWFDTQAEEAAKFYTSLFKNSRIVGTTYYAAEAAKASGRPEGSVMTVEFELSGQRFTALNGGPIFKFTEALSLVVHCDTQEEVDHFWHGLSAGGEEVQCGWLKDKFGLSWQVVPRVLLELIQDKDPARSNRVMAEMMKMKKIDIEALRKAAKGQAA